MSHDQLPIESWGGYRAAPAGVRLEPVSSERQAHHAALYGVFHRHWWPVARPLFRPKRRLTGQRAAGRFLPREGSTVDSGERIAMLTDRDIMNVSAEERSPRVGLARALLSTSSFH